MTVTNRDELLQEISFIGYYFHWPLEQILRLSCTDRHRFCEEINRINREISGEKNIFKI